MARSGLQLSFFIHAVVYAMVVGGLIMLNLRTSPTGVTWAGLVAWGWGIGLAAHAVVWLWLRRRA